MYGILLYDGVEPIDVGAAFGVLSMASRIAPGLQFVGIARRRGEVVCANGLRVVADHDYASAPDTLTDLIVTGGPGWTRAAEDQETLDFIRGTRARVTSMCTGAMILAAAGTLDGKQSTTKREVFEGEVPPLDLLAKKHAVTASALVDSGGVVTSGGVTLGLDAMFYCLARSHGETIAADVARVMEYSRALAVNKAALGYRRDG
ncbi:ThiJ/PfpI domain protein [alpha proteobacterium BAL199]|jgi:transcriptional regulator GlxA family with amidase domain|nr:ThiJ/PfpI domain protein [alpha proteobacterium BAL199]